MVDGEHNGERMEGMSGGVSVRVYVSKVSVRGRECGGVSVRKGICRKSGSSVNY